YLAPVAAPVDEVSQAEAGEHLWELRRMSEGIGRVRDARARAELFGDAAPLEEVAHVCFARRHERIGLYVPRSDLHASRAYRALEVGAPLRPDLEVVLEDYRLPVQ